MFWLAPLLLLITSCTKFTANPLIELPPSDSRYSSAKNISPLKAETNRLFLSSDGGGGSGVRSLVAGGITQILAIFDVAQLEKTPRKNWDKISQQIPAWPLSQKDQMTKVISNQLFARINLSTPLKKSEIEQILKTSRTLIAVTEDVSVQSSGYESDPTTSAALDYTATVKRSVAAIGTGPRVRVAVIDTGLANPTGQFSNALPSQPILDLTGQGNYDDKNGHGTMVASILASKAYGLAEGQIELLPIRASATPNFSSMDAISAIALATNMGAEVVVLPLSGVTSGCSPVVGHAIYTAIEKGVFFALSAGNGLEYLGPGFPGIGFPLVAASEDRPLSFQPTSTPGCWGKFFLGAVTAANLVKGADRLANTSNFGEELEIAALGSDVPVINHTGSVVKLDGSSASAAMVGAAAAVAMYHHKKNGYRYTPWYIENLIAESARSSAALKDVERRPRFGSVLSFNSLLNLLKRTQTMTAEQREQIPSINPRYGEGWLPGMDTPLKSLRLSAQRSVITPNDSLDMKAVVFYNDTQSERDVTSDPNTIWQIGLLGDTATADKTKQLVSISPDGRISLNAAALSRVFDGIQDRTANIAFQVVGVYTEKQHQALALFPFQVTRSQMAGVKSLALQAQASTIKAGDRAVRITAYEKTKNGDAEVSVDVTGSATWESSDALTFRPTQQAGIFDALNARMGGSYTVRARYGGMETSLTVPIRSENVQSYEIFSALGDGGAISQDQSPQFVSRLNLSDRSYDIPAKWVLDGRLLTENETTILLDGKKLSAGSHTLSATAVYLLASEQKEVRASKTFTIDVGINRIEASADRVVMAAGGEALLNARVYFTNNSYQTITGNADLSWAVTPAGLLTIQSNGKAVASANAAGKTATVRASYKGKTSTFTMAITYGSTVTGSQSQLVALEFDGTFYECQYHPEHVSLVYRDGSRRAGNAASVTNEVVGNGQRIPYDYTPATMLAGAKMVTTYAYNDGSTASGGGGSVQTTREFIIPPFTVEEPTFSKQLYYLFSELEPANAITFSRCAYNTSVQYSPSFTGKVGSGSAPVGQHTVTATWYSNASGIPTRKTKTFNFEVQRDSYRIVAGKVYTPSQPEQTVSYNDHIVGWPYPVPIWYGLQSTRGTFGLASQKYVQDNVNASYLNQSTGRTETVRLEGQDERWGQANEASITGTLCIEPTGNDRIVVTVNDRASRTTAKTNVSLIASNVDRSNPAVTLSPIASVTEMPSSAPPATKCSPAQKAGTRFPAGTGRETDPFLVCSMDQFNQIGKNTDNYVYSYELGDSLDFENRAISGVANGGALIGNGYELKNIVIVDSEKNGQALFRHFNKVTNLRVTNVVVKGRDSVGAVCDRCQMLTNIYLTNAIVTGSQEVGGVAGSSAWMRDVYAKNVQVSSLKGITGGLVGSLMDPYAGKPSLEHCAFSGTVRSTGAGADKTFGGLAGSSTGAVIRASSFRGDIVANAGIVGGVVADAFSGALVIGNSVEGNVVSTGASVGGIVGRIHGGWALNVNRQHPLVGTFTPNYFAVPAPLPTSVSNGWYIGSNSFRGGVWGGMSLQTLKCREGLTTVLGTYGSVTCDGDTAASAGGTSETGGIAGSVANGVTVANNTVVGTVRSVNQSGGLVGALTSYSQVYSNQVRANVSISSPSGASGKLVGSFTYLGCKDVPSTNLARFMRDNTAPDSPDLVRWDTGEYRYLSGAIEKRLRFP